MVIYHRTIRILLSSLIVLLVYYSYFLTTLGVETLRLRVTEAHKRQCGKIETHLIGRGG